MEDLGVLPAGSSAANPTRRDERPRRVVGIADGRFGYSPFLYTDAHGMIDLRDRITTAERLAFSMDVAEAINNAGQIVAGYNSPTGAYGTVRLTPVLREFGGPVAAPTVEPSELRPVNNRMVPVTVDPHVTDECDPEAACRIVRVVNSRRRTTGRIGTSRSPVRSASTCAPRAAGRATTAPTDQAGMHRCWRHVEERRDHRRARQRLARSVVCPINGCGLRFAGFAAFAFQRPS
jgi:hypothetical protein